MVDSALTIVQVLPALEGGGVERGTVELSAELVRKGHRSFVISGGGRLVQTLEEQGGTHITWPIGKKSITSLRWIRPLRKLLQEQAVDIVHARSRVPAWITWFAWKGMSAHTRPRFLTTAHGLYSVNRFSEIMASGERVIAISETVRNYLRSNYHRLNHAQIDVIPRGIDPHEFPFGYQPSTDWLQRWQAEHPHLAGKQIISIIGRITRLKGHADFLEIIHRLRQNGRDVHGLIVGGTDPRKRAYAEELQALVYQKGLHTAVTFTGHRDDVKEIYAISDLVTCLTFNPPEAFGRTTVEALSIGTPVMGYDHGGTGEILRNLFPQGLVPLQDVNAAAAVAEELLTQRPQLQPQTIYLKSRMLQQTLDIYEEMAA